MDIEGYEGLALTRCAQTIENGATFFVEVHVDTLEGLTVAQIVNRFDNREVYIATDPTDAGCKFIRYEGGDLPVRRFYLIAA
jgi:hypothetical protein